MHFNQKELEATTIVALKEYRKSLKAAEVAEARLTESKTGRSAQALNDECERLRRRTQANHLVLAALLDMLGYIPDVPADKQVH